MLLFTVSYFVQVILQPARDSVVVNFYIVLGQPGQALHYLLIKDITLRSKSSNGNPMLFYFSINKEMFFILAGFFFTVFIFILFFII